MHHSPYDSACVYPHKKALTSGNEYGPRYVLLTAHERVIQSQVTGEMDSGSTCFQRSLQIGGDNIEPLRNGAT